jgi:hypothetical protein
MPEVIPVVLVFVLMLVCGYAGFRAGHDKAQREAWYTISTLRESLTRTRLALAQANERNARLTAARRTPPVVNLPEWAREES